MLILTLILPWTTALFTRFMGGSAGDFIGLAEALPEAIRGLLTGLPSVGNAEQVGRLLVGASVFAPLMLMSLVIGLSWNRKRWLISAAIFHVIFAFFFTTVFTNIAGLGTGMIYSLGYWLEQQGVRRGSQPQYYYLLIIMPTYEFLPIVGTVSAMFAGVTCFWKSRRKRLVRKTKLSAKDKSRRSWMPTSSTRGTKMPPVRRPTGPMTMRAPEPSQKTRSSPLQAVKILAYRLRPLPAPRRKTMGSLAASPSSFCWHGGQY